MSELGQAIEDANPNPGPAPVWENYDGGRLDTMMLKRISRTALRLPQEFNERSLGNGVIVYGETDAADRTTIHVHHTFAGKKPKPSEIDTINLWRPGDGEPVTDLDAERVLMRADGGMRVQRFGSHVHPDKNTFSLFRVMRSVDLAAKTVETADLARYYAEHPQAVNISEF